MEEQQWQDHKRDHHSTNEKIDRVLHQLHELREEIHSMAISQEVFDTDLASLVSSITNLTTAVDEAIASKPAADLTAEDETVLAAAQAVSDELSKLTPAPPTP